MHRAALWLLLFGLLLALASCGGTTDKSDNDNTQKDPEPPAEGASVYWGGAWQSQTGVFETDASTKDVTTLFEETLTRIEVAPGDPWFMIVKSDGSVSMRGETKAALPTEAVEPATLAPNGRRILYVKDGSLYETAVGAAGSRLLAANAGQAAYRSTMNLIVYVKSDGIYIEAPGSAEKAAPIVVPNGDILVSPGNPAMRPAFSPDGRYVAVPINVSQSSGTILATYIINAQTRMVDTWLFNATYPTWASDSTRMAYVSQGNVYVWNHDTEGNEQFSFASDGVTRDPRFTPGDEYLLFVTREGESDLVTAMHVEDRVPSPIVKGTAVQVAGYDWERPSYCAEGNAAPTIARVELVGMAEAGAPATINIFANDADCNLPLGVIFAERDGVKQTAGWAMPAAVCDGEPAPVTLTFEAEGTYEVAFSIEDDCGATSGTETLSITVGGGDDDDTDDDTDDDADDDSDDDTADDDTADDDTADDDTTDDDTADDDTTDDDTADDDTAD